MFFFVSDFTFSAKIYAVFFSFFVCYCVHYYNFLVLCVLSICNFQTLFFSFSVCLFSRPERYWKISIFLVQQVFSFFFWTYNSRMLIIIIIFSHFICFVVVVVVVENRRKKIFHSFVGQISIDFSSFCFLILIFFFSLLLLLLLYKSQNYQITNNHDHSLTTIQTYN